MADPPNWLIWSRDDKTVSSADMQQFVKLMPGIDYQIIEGSGQILRYKAPEVVHPPRLNTCRIEDWKGFVALESAVSGLDSGKNRMDRGIIFAVTSF